jgi:preprotein translocase subunit SecG
MISGHDSTSSADEIFLFKALGLNETEKYIFPRYAAQLALEVRTKDDSKEKTSYADYYVVGYFNDKELFNVPADEFISKVEGEIWSQEKIDEFCGFGDSEITPINPSGNNSNSSGSTDSKKKDNAKTAYKVLMSIFICLSAILLATTLFLCYKLSQSKPPLDTHYNNSNISTNKINV